MEGPSRTAVLSAVARALHREESPPWVLDDPLGFELAGDEAVEVRAEILARVRQPGLGSFIRWTCVRARRPEDIVEDAMHDGVRQYVVLGAGLDTFAYRRRELLQRGLRVFEVDHPATQEWKRARLGVLGIGMPSSLVYAPVDFERQTLDDALADAGFDAASPAVFSWIGVTMYLTLDAIAATLASVARSASGTRIALTYDLPKEALSGIAESTATALRSITAGMGEPYKSVFRPEEIEAVLREQGFANIEHFGPDEALATYFPRRDDVMFIGAQRLIAGIVS